MLLGCLFLLHLPHAVMSFSLFPIFISLVSHQCLHSALLLHLLLCLTAHLLSGRHFSAYLCQRKKTLNPHSSLYSFYCLSYSLHAANTQSRWIKGISPCLISFRIMFHRHFKINFVFSYFMIRGKQLKNFLSVSESTIVTNGSFTLHQAPLFLKVTASRNTPLFGFISPWPMKAKKIDELRFLKVLLSCDCEKY